MTDFIRRNNDLERLPSMVAGQVLGFDQSEEYRALQKYEQSIPGVVCAAFARYLVRLYSSRGSGPMASVEDAAIVSAHEVLEELASSPETAVESLVSDEIYETFDDKPVVAKMIERDLRPRARELYRRHSNRAGPY